MRPIAMRCTQEQFDSIKDRINLPINSVTNFKKYPYLINFDSCNSISNVEKSEYWGNIWNQNPEIHEIFNADIFLEACGVEVEKVWHHSQIQFKDTNGDWENAISCDNNRVYRLKPQFNSADCLKEIEALQQKAKEKGMSVIIKFEKL